VHEAVAVNLNLRRPSVVRHAEATAVAGVHEVHGALRALRDTVLLEVADTADTGIALGSRRARVALRASRASGAL
jgi:hypothetical protein